MFLCKWWSIKHSLFVVHFTKNCTAFKFLTFDMNGQMKADTLLPLPASTKIFPFLCFRFHIPGYGVPFSASIAAWLLSPSTTIFWLRIFSESRSFAISKIERTSVWNTVLPFPRWKMLFLGGNYLGILHKNLLPVSHLISSHQCKPWECSDLERSQIW